MRPGELAQHLRQHHFAKIFLHAQPHPAGKLAALHRARGLVVQFQQAAAIGQHGLARLGQRQPAPGFAQQWHAGLLFQLFHLRADGGRRAAQAVGRTAKTAQVHARNKAAQHIQVKGHRPH
ncbi:hypothetical protein D3C71_1425070 [compost metagenome]